MIPMKKTYFFLFLLFLSYNAQSQHNFNNQISDLDTIGASPIELPRYADKHNIKRMMKVRLQQKGSLLAIGDGSDINIGQQKGTIEDIKEYDWRGNITLDVEYAALGPYDIPYEYTYDDNNKRKILESADKLGTYQTNLNRYFYNEKNQLDSIQKVNLFFDENDSSFHHKGTTFFDYNDLGRLERKTFLYENIRSNSNVTDTVGITFYECKDDTCNIIKYTDIGASFDFYRLIYNRKGQIIEQQNEYRTEKYEYNAAGWISKTQYFSKKNTLEQTTDYFYDKNNLLVGSENYSPKSKYKTEVIYIYEFY